MAHTQPLSVTSSSDGDIFIMMKFDSRLILKLAVALLVVVKASLSSPAQEVFIPDPDLNAAIRVVLGKPIGPLTQLDLLNLTNLNACCRNIANLQGLEAAHNLTLLDISSNQLTRLILPAGLTNLSFLFVRGNQLTNFVLPADLAKLVSLDLGANQLTSLTLPTGLDKLIGLFLVGNPLVTFVLPEPLATTNLVGPVTLLRDQGVNVFTYPVTIQLTKLIQLPGAFRFGITGPPGDYTVFSSTNLADWSVLGATPNPLGSVLFTDVNAHLAPQKFYRALRQTPPVNMVFIPANTFIMGSPTNELHRNVNEGPQITVILTHGFWIGRYEVTQGEYLDVTGMNPSVFPGDLSRPVSSVSWPDATNYCWLLTQRELTAGHISPGSKYRLPTEAEWECAARAGTTTRFSYGDDLDYSSLTNHAWFWMNGGFSVHPVGQKLPNPWGLYDMEGNVWEWTQDWLGDLSGVVVTDPQGPATNPIGWKVVRGGGYDFGESDCRSARRFFFGNHPALNDSNLGFRVVLVTEP